VPWDGWPDSRECQRYFLSHGRSPVQNLETHLVIRGWWRVCITRVRSKVLLLWLLVIFFKLRKNRTRFYGFSSVWSDITFFWQDERSAFLLCRCSRIDTALNVLGRIAEQPLCPTGLAKQAWKCQPSGQEYSALLPRSSWNRMLSLGLWLVRAKSGPWWSSRRYAGHTTGFQLFDSFFDERLNNAIKSTLYKGEAVQYILENCPTELKRLRKLEAWSNHHCASPRTGSRLDDFFRVVVPSSGSPNGSS